MNICAHCQTENPDGAKFCMNCGQSLALACPNCGTELPANAKFCFSCGHQMAAATVAAPAADTPAPIASTTTEVAAAERTPNLDRYIPGELLQRLEQARDSAEMVGERRIVTMLFCDVKGSTAAAAQLDPEEWAEIINGAFEHMIAPIYQYEGTVARLMGDGILAFFGAPLAHEDDPQRAILAGLDIIESLQPYRQQVQAQWGLDINVRVGINTGLVVVGAVGSDLRMEYTALGDAINLAARMEQSAEPGTVQIAEATYKLAAPLFDVEPIEGLEVKGRSEPITAYRVIKPKEQPQSLRGIEGLDSPLVGRDQDFAQLMEAIDTTVAGSGQIVSVMGEAGLGKSRLIAEARQQQNAGADKRPRWIEGRSLSYETTTPFTPFAGLLAEALKLPADVELADQYDHLRTEVEMHFPGRGEEMASALAQPLNLPVPAGEDERIKYLEPPALRDLVFATVADFLRGLATERPLIMVVDDIHWTDPTSLELLQSLFPLTEQVPLLILLAFRPRRQDPSWQLHETAARDFGHRYTSLSLRPLDDSQARELVHNLLAVEGLPESLRQLMLDKSEGNPFFLEEVIRSLLDADLVVPQNGHWVAAAEITELKVPDTLNGVITARLDQLDDTARATAQAGAVLGREFSIDILGDIGGAKDTLEDSLSLLLRRELIREKSHLPVRRYQFKHALTQDAAYNSLLLSRRRQLHLAAAESLVVREPDEAAEIARHFLAARQPGQALPYLVQAGEQAAHAYATPEAIGFFTQVLEHQDLADITILRRAYEGLGAAQGLGIDPAQALATYQQMLAAAEVRGDVDMQASALNKMGSVLALQMGQFAEAEPHLTRAEELTRDQDLHDEYAELSVIRCQMCTAQADFDSVIAYLGDLVDIADQIDNPAFKSMGLEHISSSLMLLTRFDEGYEKAREGLRIAQSIGDRQHEADFLANVLPLYHAREGDLDTALASIEKGVALSRRIGSFLPMIQGDWYRAEIYRWRGEYEAALAAIQRSLDTALPAEEFAPALPVIPLGTLGSIYLELSDQFKDRVAGVHNHAMRLLESPAGAAGGGSAWADLGWCAMTLGDLEIAEQVFEKGLNYPSIFNLLERPRHLAGSAMLLLEQGQIDEARQMAEEACEYIEERRMQNLYPLVWLTMGRVLASSGDHEAALVEFERAEEAAVRMQMRPLVWQSRAVTADSMAALGRDDEAADLRQQAQATIKEIANLIEDEELREAYLTYTLGRVLA